MKKPDIRYLYDMKKVVYDKKWLEKAPNLELYYMYRGLKKKGDLRYDVTVIPPRMLGEEFVRTKGNRNSKNFPELYTVLEGEAIFLLQKTRAKNIKIVEDVLAIKAKPKESIFISAEYAAIMINPSKKTLKTGNWVSEKNKNIYGELEKMKGACYFAIAQKSKIKNKKSKIKWIKNKNYKKVPKLRFEKPLKSIPKNLDFLKGK